MAYMMDDRSLKRIDPEARPNKCQCGCETMATHVGMASGMPVMSGCELYVRRWVKLGWAAVAKVREA